MLDRDLAELYGVETRALNQAVKRNTDRFPEDFMFRLTSEDAKTVLLSRSQIVTLKRGHNIKYLPYVFHRTRGGDTRERPQKRRGGPRQHPGGPGLRSFAAAPCHE